MPLVELVNGRRYVHMGFRKTFTKGNPVQVTDEEADYLLGLTGKVRVGGNEMRDLALFQLKRNGADRGNDPKDEIQVMPESDVPIRRRGRPKKVAMKVHRPTELPPIREVEEKNVKLEYVD